jgi:hypothetical protein
MNLPPDHLPLPHPLPPIGFESRILPTIETSGLFYRLSSVRHPSALYFDRSGRGRFVHLKPTASSTQVPTSMLRSLKPLEDSTGNLLDNLPKLLAEILAHYDYGLF